MKNYLVNTPFGFRSGIKAGDIVPLDDESAAELLACGAIEPARGVPSGLPLAKASGVSSGLPLEKSSGASSGLPLDKSSGDGESLEGKKFAELLAIATDEGLALDPKIKSKADAIKAIEAHRAELVPPDLSGARPDEASVQGQAPA